METDKTTLQRALVSGSMASLVSTATLALLGKRSDGSAFGPTNAVSHWLWGEKAARQDSLSMRYTLIGYTVHHASAIFWALLFERLLGNERERQDPVRIWQAGTATSAVACLVDYQLTPKRLQPGFEKRLSPLSLGLVYGAFGIGLAAGALLLRSREAAAPGGH